MEKNETKDILCSREEVQYMQIRYWLGGVITGVGITLGLIALANT